MTTAIGRPIIHGDEASRSIRRNRVGRSPPISGRLRRVAWLTVGIVALGAAIVGAVLPLVPTTPFLPVAAFAFACSSRRLHDLLLTDPRFGPAIRKWLRDRSISRPARHNSIVAIIATLLLSWGVGVAGLALAVSAIVLTAVAVFILSRPDGGAS